MDDIEELEHELEVARETGNVAAEATHLHELGAVLLRARHWPQAVRHFRQAAAIFRDTGEHAGEAAALTNLGSAFAELGEAAQAIEAYRRALALYETLNSPAATPVRARLAALHG